MAFEEQIKATFIEECQLAELLCTVFNCEVRQEVGHNPYYDGTMMFDWFPVRYEFKDESNLAPKTGNHFVEISSRGVDSGILTTKSSIWIVKVGFVYYLVPTQVIRNKIKDKTLKRVRGGDKVNGRGSSIGYLVPIEWIKNNKKTTIISTENPNELDKQVYEKGIKESISTD